MASVPNCNFTSSAVSRHTCTSKVNVRSQRAFPITALLRQPLHTPGCSGSGTKCAHIAAPFWHPISFWNPRLNEQALNHQCFPKERGSRSDVWGSIIKSVEETKVWYSSLLQPINPVFSCLFRRCWMQRWWRLTWKRMGLFGRSLQWSPAAEGSNFSILAVCKSTNNKSVTYCGKHLQPRYTAYWRDICEQKNSKHANPASRNVWRSRLSAIHL